MMNNDPKVLEEIIFNEMMMELIYGNPEKNIPPTSAEFLLPPAITEIGEFNAEVSSGDHGRYFVIIYDREHRYLAMTAKVELCANERAIGLRADGEYTVPGDMERIATAYREHGLVPRINPWTELRNKFVSWVKLSDRFAAFREDHCVPRRFTVGDNFIVCMSIDTKDRVIFTFKTLDDRTVGFFSCSWTGDRAIVSDHPYLCSISHMSAFIEGFDTWPVINDN